MAVFKIRLVLCVLVWCPVSFVDLDFFIADPIIGFPMKKIDIDETNWTPNQYTEYPNLYIKTAKRAAPNP